MQSLFSCHSCEGDRGRGGVVGSRCRAQVNSRSAERTVASSMKRKRVQYDLNQYLKITVINGSLKLVLP